jgi:hypothetical protein
MKTFYVSLVRDLLGCYIEFQAESELAVRQYLVKEYFEPRYQVWKLPWCSVYEVKPTIDRDLTIIKAKSGPLYEEKISTTEAT